MEKTGVLRTNDSDRVSRIENFRKLARAGEEKPLQAGHDFVAEKGHRDSDTIKVTGDLGALDDGTPVCFITDAVAAAQALAKKTARASARSSAKAGAGKKGAKKGGAKKRGSKKGAAGKSRKGGAKRTTKKGASKRSSKKTRRQ